MWPHFAGWDRRLLTNSLCRHTACLQSEPGPSRSPVPTSRTVCRRMWPPLDHCRCSDNAWRQFCSAAAIRTYVLSELCLPSLTVVLAVFSFMMMMMMMIWLFFFSSFSSVSVFVEKVECTTSEQQDYEEQDMLGINHLPVYRPDCTNK